MKTSENKDEVTEVAVVPMKPGTEEPDYERAVVVDMTQEGAEEKLIELVEKFAEEQEENDAG